MRHSSIDLPSRGLALSPRHPLRSQRTGRRTGALTRGLPCLLVGLLACSQVQVVAIDQGDTFTQEGGHVTTDILWVIDDSGTMSEEQQALALSLPTFLNALLQADIDFHLGVIRTDASNPDTAGILQGEPNILTRETPELATEFAETAAVGINGEREERGFSAVLTALELDSPGLPNAGFVRSDAELAVLFVSDEDDQSDETVGSFVQRLQRHKGSQRLSLHALVGDVPMGCSASTGAADAGTRYLQAVDATDGVSSSICGELKPWMKAVVQHLAHLQDTFPLSKVPDPGSIEVRVEDVLLHEREVDGWTYLPDINAVRISGTPMPEAGQTISIVYDAFRL